MKKKNKNKGFSLVELIVVVAIMAILVGVLGPQYIKYVERSRQSADANNLEALVTSLKIAGADGIYTIPNGKYTFQINQDGAKLTYQAAQGAAGGTAIGKDVIDAVKEYTGYDFGDSAEGSSDPSNIRLKSGKWQGNAISAVIDVTSTGAMTVTYTPEDLLVILDNTSKK